MTADAGEPYPRLSLEAAIARSPQVIILASHGSGQGRMVREKWERFTALPAVKAGRLYTVDGNLLHRYGPRIVDGLEQLARAIHPEAFPSGTGQPARVAHEPDARLAALLAVLALVAASWRSARCSWAARPSPRVP